MRGAIPTLSQYSFLVWCSAKKNTGTTLWTGHVARMGRGEVFTGFWLGGPKVRDHWEDLGVDGP
jgi:hypothetical protein